MEKEQTTKSEETGSANLRVVITNIVEEALQKLGAVFAVNVSHFVDHNREAIGKDLGMEIQKDSKTEKTLSTLAQYGYRSGVSDVVSLMGNMLKGVESIEEEASKE